MLEFLDSITYKELAGFVLLPALIILNLSSFALMGIDKQRAREGAWRIPEKRLFLSAILGGSLGAIAGMKIFHHKTKHWYFRLGMPAIFLLQLALFSYLGYLMLH